MKAENKLKFMITRNRFNIEFYKDLLTIYQFLLKRNKKLCKSQ